ncbi:MAG: prepilin peptidase, partial [Patescibacteria group bacterium]
MVETGLVVFFLFCFGAAIGSFLHVVGERYGTRLSFSKGNSFCPHCKKSLSARELIPIFSYIFSAAKCRGCKTEIPVSYPITELLTGLLAVALLYNGNILLFLAACLLIILIRIDSNLMLLPDNYIYLLIGISIAYARYINADFTDIIFGMLAGAGSLYLLWIGTSGRGLGFGDVKLMIPLGILFGFQGVVALLFLAFFVGGLLSIFLLACGRVGPKTAIEFGPFLAGSALCL